MRNTKNVLILTLVLILTGLFAGYTYAVTLSPVPSYGITCSGITQGTGGAQATYDRDTSGTGNETLRYEVIDGDGTILFSVDDTLPVGSVPTMVGFSYSVSPDYNPIRFVLSSPAGNGFPEQILVSITNNCAGLPTFVASDSGDSLPVAAVAPDNRINWQYGDANIGILYPGNDGAIDLYDYETQTYYSDFIMPDEISNVQANPPASPLLVKSLGRISVYVLPDGHIQVNFGPDNEGKMWVLLMDDLSDRENEGSYYRDPNQ